MINHTTIHTKRIIAALLSVLFFFMSFFIITPRAYAADEPQPEETALPAEPPAPSEDTAVPPDESVPTPDTPQAADASGIITEADGTMYASDEVIVKFKRTVSDSAAAATLEAQDSSILQDARSNVVVADVPDGETVGSFIDTLQGQPGVEFAQPNFMYEINATVNDPGVTSQWYLSSIGAPNAWDITMGTSDVRVAVLDTGIDLTHPEFAGQIYVQADTVTDDGNAQDDSISYSCYGHGTHVAGIIAAKANNSTGISGIAPGVKLIPVDVFNGSGAWTSDIVEGIQFAVANGADVINMSFGGYGSDSYMESALNNAVGAGVVCVAAAGNDNTDAYFHPSDYDSVISVIATGSDDTKAYFSNYGALKDISAPGLSIYSTVPGNGYASWSGTSMASPVVAGVAALMRSVNPSLTVGEIKNILYDTATDLGTAGKDNTFANGKVNAYNAAQESAKQYTVSVSKSLTVGSGDSYGTVSSGGTYTSCTPITLTATPADNYRFVRWSENGTQVSTDSTYRFIIKSDVALTAEFEQTQYPVNASANNAYFGSVSGGGTFFYGDMVTLTAAPKPLCTFIRWAENGVTVSTDLVYPFTATKTTSLTAEFAGGSCNISANSETPEIGWVSGGGLFTVGTTVQLHAYPYTGHRFVRWTENGTEISKDPDYSFIAANHANLSAVFAALTPVSVSCIKTDVSVYGSAGGTITATAAGGDSGAFQYSLGDGVWNESGFFTGLPAGSYMVFARDKQYIENVSACTVSINQPDLMTVVPAKKMPSKVNAGTAITIIPPAAPRGYATQSVFYSSGNPSVAAVDADGNVTFLGGGKTTIITKVVSTMVDSKGRVKTKTTTVRKTVTVKQLVSSMSLNLSDTTIIRSKKVKLIPSFYPAAASSKKVKWTSSDKKIATVSSSGIVTGKSAGTAVITCSATDGSGVTAGCVVTVTPIYPTGIRLSKPALSIKTGKSAALKATVLPKNADFKSVTWVSSDPGIAAVDTKGRVSGTAPGAAVITAATSEGQTAVCTVTVK